MIEENHLLFDFVGATWLALCKRSKFHPIAQVAYYAYYAMRCQTRHYTVKPRINGCQRTNRFCLLLIFVIAKKKWDQCEAFVTGGYPLLEKKNTLRLWYSTYLLTHSLFSTFPASPSLYRLSLNIVEHIGRKTVACMLQRNILLISNLFGTKSAQTNGSTWRSLSSA